MKRSRTVIGLLLIVFSVAGLIFWEVRGRETVLLDTVIVAKEKIPAGMEITRDRVSSAGVLAENRIQGSLDWKRLPEVVGCVALQDIVANSQISTEHLADGDFYIRSGQSIFVIHPDWITMRSSSLRRGDWVDIYASMDSKKIGSYRVAFVKDANELEVTDGEGRTETNPLNRTISTAPISHLEIIADMKEYGKILDSLHNGGGGLLLIQKQAVIR